MRTEVVATVLLIDDDQVIVHLLKTVVEEAGHEAVIASGLEQVPDGLAPDVIVTDLVPLKAYRREDAQRWIRELRGRFPRVPLVVVTAHGSAVDEAEHLGANAVMAKPFDVEGLSAKLTQLLAGG